MSRILYGDSKPNPKTGLVTYTLLQNCTPENPDGEFVATIQVRDPNEAHTLARRMGWTIEE